MAPSAGEGLRAAAILGGEEGDDGAEDGVREATDEIAASLAAVAATTPCPLSFDAMGSSFLEAGPAAASLAVLLSITPWPPAGETEGFGSARLVLGTGFGLVGFGLKNNSDLKKFTTK